MAILHNLGYPRIGEDRELKRAIEKFWQGKIDESELKNIGQQLRQQNWQTQQSAGIDLLPVGDFAWYDHILQLALTFGVVPSRHRHNEDASALTQLFNLARGTSNEQGNQAALEMTKWFDTNYHYLVPEFEANQQFELGHSPLLEQIDEAKAQSLPIKAVVTGPLTFLYLGRFEHEQKLLLLPALLKGYQQLLAKIAEKGVDWVQIDEPILALELEPAWHQAFADAYQTLGQSPVKLLLTSYFGSISIPLSDIAKWPVSGIHLDLIRAPEQLDAALNQWPIDKVFSLGVIDGRNIWRSDLNYWLDILEPVNRSRGDNLWLAPSCSLLHVPVNLEREHKLDSELKSWLSFAKQKLSELVALGHHLDNKIDETDRYYLALSQQVVASRAQSLRITNPAVRSRIDRLTEDDFHRANRYPERAKIQHQSLKLPLLPTTTIGSFPQTSDIRATRSAFVKGDITQAEYDAFIAGQIDEVIRRQEQLGLDVLVHGEPERNDMVEYFAPYLNGVGQTQYGWVQSYGTRCVKPPVIYGDVSRAEPMTVRWSTYAQSRSDKPVKGMLTGPQTILGWSFVRSDIARADVADQIALALRDEVDDLQKAGINIIQIDEPALREGLPLKRSQWLEYLNRAVRAFRLCASIADDATQVHTHMCYSQFNDIIASIAQMDADVITIETSRSAMKLLDAFKDFNYPNEIGPGVYDIHSPVVPKAQWMEKLLILASEKIPLERLWVNPDCGLKTRDWPETLASLQVMVDVARKLREQFKNS
ncbi:5-methyltetrahydropteroyltriglutamate--homocysteine S-methyltransferase [Celerinatantimonas sp. MCCC 1A17872]|uniref:5-methyltetrahydropteroyltriglutamate-- homocysteine S-methyltransferase n=1 Tax=Celerinatantimonas sp. MCCC 1A17872 TaxID=3177514 RepID=UPI0038C7381C